MTTDDEAAASQEFVDALTEPAAVFDRHLDVVAANALAGAVSASMSVGTNLARFTFLNPYVEDAVAAWEREAHRTAAALRASLAAHGEDPRFRELIGELMAASPAFADEWTSDVAATVTHGTSTIENPLVGRMVLRWDQLLRGGDPDQVVILWTAADVESAARLALMRQRIAA